MDDENDYDDAEYPNDREERIEALEERLTALEAKTQELSSSFATSGYCLGMVIAVVISWSRNGSILWCILHGALSWIYVVYFAVTR